MYEPSGSQGWKVSLMYANVGRPASNILYTRVADW